MVQIEGKLTAVLISGKDLKGDDGALSEVTWACALYGQLVGRVQLRCLDPALAPAGRRTVERPVPRRVATAARPPVATASTRHCHSCLQGRAPTGYVTDVPWSRVAGGQTVV